MENFSSWIEIESILPKKKNSKPGKKPIEPEFFNWFFTLDSDELLKVTKEILGLLIKINEKEEYEDLEDERIKNFLNNYKKADVNGRLAIIRKIGKVFTKV